ncbi:MAG: pyruvate kinase [Anaerolineae bacterium]
MMSCELLKKLETLRANVERDGLARFHAWEPYIEREDFLPSARNLAHYLAFRQRDLRDLQVELMPWGLSSLGRAESRVLENLDAVIETLRALCEGNPRPDPLTPQFFAGNQRLERNATTVLGAPPVNRRVRIMVTFPTEAADDYNFVKNLMVNGMNCARINCAHDTPARWTAMIEHIRQAERETGRTCKIIMDLGGPKIRTAKIGFDSDTRLRTGDTLLITRGEPKESQAYPYQVSCTLPQVMDGVKVGESVWFDDGKIGAIVKDVIPEGLVLKITQARSKGEALKKEKGINFPDTELNISPLSDKDLDDLDFVLRHADMVGYSFVQRPDEIDLLQREMAKRNAARAREIAIVAKIETRTAVKNLPELIVRAAGKQNVAVMIARGDLAVEIGFDRLAEMQEELLWLCEAAHVPVIWATQVFESLVKKGLPSRAEVTDAAMGERAECVMLNKGERVVDAVVSLNSIMERMAAHQFKKTPGLRALSSWTWEATP